MVPGIPIFLFWRTNMRNLLKKSGKWIFPAIAMLLTFILLKCVFLIGYVPTESMEPTLERGSYIIGCRIYSNLETGDIIIFRHDGKLLVKRIAAMEGDMVERNGASMTVPEGCYYVLGDNADNSYDSRYWMYPFVSGDDVVAKLL
jgi:signal peptidase I